MKAIPLGSWDIANDGVLGPLWWNGFAKGNGYQKSSGCTLLVDGRIYSTSFVPSVCVLCDVLYEPLVKVGRPHAQCFELPPRTTS